MVILELYKFLIYDDAIEELWKLSWVKHLEIWELHKVWISYKIVVDDEDY